MEPVEPVSSVKVFISYAHEDQELHEKLVKHLNPLKHSGKLTIWQDQEILPGTNWDDQIKTRLKEANMILLLISSDFLDSKYCWEEEVKAALERHETGEARVIPIILRPTFWQDTSLKQLQALPTSAKPVTLWSDQDAALENVAQGIRKVMQGLLELSSGSGQEENDTNTRNDGFLTPASDDHDNPQKLATHSPAIPSHYPGKYNMKNVGPTQGQVIGEQVYVTMHFGSSQEEYEPPLRSSSNKNDHPQVSHYPPPRSLRWSRRRVVLGLVGGVGIVTAGSILVVLVTSISHPNVIPTSDPGVKGKWVATGSILQGRFGFRATTLKNDKVLIEGGDNANGQYLMESELFNVSTGTWTKTGSLNVGRFEHTATLLQDGRVLAVGGYAGPPLDSAELYDPGSGTWTPSDSLREKRTRHTATLLNDGKVLVAGGWGRYGDPIESAEIYDPDASRWSSAGKMAITRSDHIAVLLGDGKMLVAGGAPENDKHTAEAELYDGTTNTWTVTGSLNIPRSNFTAVLLPSGKVLAIGGNTPTGPTATAELYDPATGSWSLTGGMKHPRTGFHDKNALLFADGRVLIAGGDDSSSTSEIYMLGQGAWTALTNIGQVRYDGATALLNDGRVLIVGGYDGSSSGLRLSAAIYTPD